MHMFSPVVIRSPYINLGQFLKLIQQIGTGSEAKFFLASEVVLVNGIREMRRGKKLYHHDQIVVQAQTYVIVVNQDDSNHVDQSL